MLIGANRWKSMAGERGRGLRGVARRPLLTARRHPFAGQYFKGIAADLSSCLLFGFALHAWIDALCHQRASLLAPLACQFQWHVRIDAHGQRFSLAPNMGNKKPAKPVAERVFWTFLHYLEAILGGADGVEPSREPLLPLAELCNANKNTVKNTVGEGRQPLSMREL